MSKPPLEYRTVAFKPVALLPTKRLQGRSVVAVTLEKLGAHGWRFIHATQAGSMHVVLLVRLNGPQAATEAPTGDDAAKDAAIIAEVADPDSSSDEPGEG